MCTQYILKIVLNVPLQFMCCSGGVGRHGNLFIQNSDHVTVQKMLPSIVYLGSFFSLLIFVVRHGSELLNLQICIFIVGPDGNNVKSEIKCQR